MCDDPTSTETTKYHGRQTINSNKHNRSFYNTNYKGKYSKAITHLLDDDHAKPKHIVEVTFVKE
jgi:hypothetical protein